MYEKGNRNGAIAAVACACKVIVEDDMHSVYARTEQVIRKIKQTQEGNPNVSKAKVTNILKEEPYAEMWSDGSNPTFLIDEEELNNTVKTSMCPV